MICLNCEQCKSEFKVQNYRKDTARFCSRSCSGKWGLSVRKMVGQNLTGNKLRLGIPPVNKGKPSPYRGKKVKVYKKFECKHCSKEFEVVPWIERQNKSKSGDRFCTKKCHSDYMAINKAGENSPQWVGGKETYRGKSWSVARKLAVVRDKGVCQKCYKIVGNRISVHHKKPFREFDCHQRANRLTNLICLCQPCHMKVERALEKKMLNLKKRIDKK